MAPDKQELPSTEVQNTEKKTQKNVSVIIEESSLSSEEKDKFLLECRKDEEECLASLIGSKEKLKIETKNKLISLVNEEYLEKSEELIGKEGIEFVKNYFGNKGDVDTFKSIVKFQKKNNLDIDGIIGPDTLKMMKNKEFLNIVPGADNINDIYEDIANNVLNETISKLKEGIDLSKEGILRVIKDIIEGLNTNSILTAKDKQNLINNFLEPKEKGVEHIKFMLNNTILKEKRNEKKEKSDFNDFKNTLLDLINKNDSLTNDDIEKIKDDKKFNDFFKQNPTILGAISAYPYVLNNIGKDDFPKYLDDSKNNFDSSREKENLSNEYDNYFSVFKSSLLFLHDSANDKSPEEINKLIQEFKNIPAVKQIFDKVPNLKNLISDLIPGIIKNTDKSQFESSLNEFYKRSKDDIINMDRFINNKEAYGIKESKLNIINSFSDFLQANINEKSVDVLNNSLSKFDVIKSNPLLSDIVELINSGDIEGKDRLDILNKILEIVKLSTSKSEINDYIVNKVVNDNILPILSILAQKNPDKFKELFKKLIGNNKQENNDKNKIDYDYIQNLVGENLGVTKDFLLKWNGSLEDYLLNIFKDKEFIDKAVKSTGGKITEIIRNIINYDLKQVANDIKNEYLEKGDDSLKDGNNQKNDSLNKNSEKLEGDIFDNLLNQLGESGLTLLKNKINNSEKITDYEIIDKAILVLDNFVKDNESQIFEYLEGVGVKIETKEDKNNLINIIKDVIKNPGFKGMVLDFINNLGNKVKGRDVGLKIKNFIDESVKSNGENLLSNKIKGQMTDISIDTIFDNILQNTNKLNTIIKLLNNKFGKEINLNNNDAKELLLTLKEHISKEDIKNIIKKYPKLLSLDLPSDKYIDIIMDLYKAIDNKNGLVNSLLDKGLVTKLSNIDTGKTEKQNGIEDSDISLITEGIYSTLESSNNNDIGKTITKIFNKFGLADLNDIKLFNNSLGENIAIIFNSLTKEDCKNILIKNKDNLNKITSGGLDEKQQTLIFSNIGADIYSKLDIKKIQKQLDSQNLKSHEKLSLGLMDEFQDILKNDRDKINGLTKKGYDLYKMYEDEVEIKEDSDHAKNMKAQAENAFDILNSITQKIDSKYLEQNLNLDSNDEKRAKDKVFDEFIDSFIGNNKMFLIGQGWERLFGDGNNQKSIYEYFNNSKNRDNFGDTMKSFFVNVNDTKIAGRAKNNNGFFET